MKKYLLMLVSVLCLMTAAGCTEKKSDNKTPVELTEEQVAEVNEAFTQLLPSDKEDEFNINPVCHFFSSYYDDVSEMDMGDFVYYIPRTYFLSEKDTDEIDALKNSGLDILYDINTCPVPVGRIPYSTVEEYLNKYAGLSLSDMKNMGSAIRSDKYECFYSFASDFGVGYFNCTGGTIDGDTVTLYSEDSVLTLKQDGSNYHIVSYTEKK